MRSGYRAWHVWVLLSGLAFLPGAAQSAQQLGPARQLAQADRGPRFLRQGAAAVPVELDLNATPVLRRRVALIRERATLGQLLTAIRRQAGLRFVYSADVIPADRVVGLRADSITVAAALTEILLDVGVDVVFYSASEAGLVRREPPPRGSISGRVTDGRSNAAIEGAIVSLSPGRRTSSTDASGRYRFGEVDTGAYTVRVRYIGYAPLVSPVRVRAEEEVTLDLALERSAQELDQVVVTGTIVPTEVKALPTPVTVVREEEIALQRPQNIQEVFRKSVPGAVSWINSHTLYNTSFSVRGASSLVPSNTSMKILIDGVETANTGYSQVDPASIARVEVIRGPQAAAIYGSEAIGGVIQIFTKRGDPDHDRPRVNAEAAAGLVQTPYAGFRSVVRHEYKASVRGGSPGMGYNLGAGYSHLDDWLPPAGEVSRQSTPSIHGGMNLSRGILTADLTGRYYEQQGGNNLSNPEIFETGYVPYSQPYYQPHRSQNLTIGAQLGVTPRSWWRTSVRVGLDRRSVDVAQARPRLTTPSDTLLQVSARAETKPSVGLNTTVEGSLTSGLSGSLTAGVDYWTYTLSGFSTFGALTTTSPIGLAPGATVFMDRTITRNTGYFSQLQVGFRDAVFMTAGLRAEQNTDFGDSLGTPLLPRVGLTYVRPIGQATLKLRGSWGRAINPPSAGAKAGFKTSFREQLPNPDLGPERQQGWDVGVDANFGSHGSLGITYYNQVAEDLIDLVVQLTPVSTQQFQNVGRVRNSGVELEATWLAGVFALRGQYGYARARVEQLSPTYAGDLQVDDQVHLRPKHSAGVSVSVTPLTTTTLSAGVTYLGSWTGTDWMALIRCFGGTAPCRPTNRDYLMRYPSLFKLNANAVQQLTRELAGFVALDNLTNNQNFESDNIGPVMGRTTTVGIRLEY